ncbi:hypothetical protein [Mesorhizobium sp. M8A.F.Ca.ET.021.01.1.1]|uniref:hypothetical protein n=1 Tax=Mesorhizobium sp. M8A.F.Ca.ET.021.01.1.1 TaxID=2496757 RepID=UPI000FCCE11C|nr:hypothetical protein [Mesorhizobium sp. M8A.F.Ca.ET.021.01.1.1]RUW56837.1 hypothetical protein EOA36_02235 [Mesorhizobium sp. M8A.F.Ca.ET.021.01.1.1]
MTGDILFPYKPGDWVMNRAGRVAKVKSIDFWQGEYTFDLVLFDSTGEKIGRESPALGGPRTFEPSCSIDGWERCKEPDFPLRPQWVTQGDGSRVAMYWSPRLPPANWKRPKRKSSRVWAGLALVENKLFKKALEEIRDGHNDPRDLAKRVLGGA